MSDQPIPVGAGNAGEPQYEVDTKVFQDMVERKDLGIFQSLGGVEGIAAKLHTDPKLGITTAAGRAARYGRNVLPEPEKVTFFGLVWEALHDRMMQMLIVAAIISIIFGMTLEDPVTHEVERKTGWIEGTAILVSVIIVVMVTATNDYQKAKQFEELNKQQAKKEVEVIRKGENHTLDVADLLVGDLVYIQNGQTLSADGIFVEGQDVVCDESAATGESDLKKKNIAKDPFLLSGTNVTEGSGLMVIIAVGESSFSGKVAMDVRQEASETPLQEKLGSLADTIGKVGMVGALLTFAVLAIKEIILIATGQHKGSIVPFLDFIIVSITIVVVAIPEGLPLAVTIALAYSMKSMIKDNCLVRVLASCETMGGTSTICSDKTGTLTKNEMTVVQGWIAREDFVIDGFEVHGPSDATHLANQEGGGVALRTPKPLIEELCRGISLNSTAKQEEIDGKLVWTGNKTEFGLLGFVKRAGYDFLRLRNSVPGTHKRTYPFSSAKKRMTTVVSEEHGWTIFVKGASEMVLADCDRVQTPGGELPLTAEERQNIESAINHMAGQGNRTLAMAYAKVPAKPDFPENEPGSPDDRTELRNIKFVLFAVLGIQDPIREEVPAAVAKCKTAGITVRMVTGDNINTAKAIAKKCGIYKEDEHFAMEGPDFRAMAESDPEGLLRRLPRLTVIARSSPTDKLTLVKNLQKLGDIVAVTGDGTNDAPALKNAEVGFAMNSGTEIAKGAAEMVLIDDNFATVVRATVWGRTVNDNIRKFLQFQLTVNVVGVLMTFIGAAVSPDNESPLKPVQLLWLNLVMDTMAALALATEKPSEECLLRNPISRQAPLISRKMKSFVLGHGAFQLTTMMLLINLGHEMFALDPCASGEAGHTTNGHCKLGDVHSTIVFNTFILMQVFNEINARKLYGESNPLSGMLTRSRALLLVLLVTVLVQVFAVQVAGEFMHTVPLNAGQWFACLGIASIEIPMGIIVRLLPVKNYEPPPREEEEFTKEQLLAPVVAPPATEAAAPPADATIDVPESQQGQPSPTKRWQRAAHRVILENRAVEAFRKPVFAPADEDWELATKQAMSQLGMDTLMQMAGRSAASRSKRDSALRALARPRTDSADFRRGASQ